jgi:hypothetical protein
MQDTDPTAAQAIVLTPTNMELTALRALVASLHSRLDEQGAALATTRADLDDALQWQAAFQAVLKTIADRADAKAELFQLMDEYDEAVDVAR